MFDKTPELYDRIYGSFKDYSAEAADIAGLLGRVAPEARRVLDVACGTGTHVLHLRREHGFEVDGLDIEAGFLELARGKVPEARFWQCDMADFELDTTFDAILCLFSSVGYVREVGRLHDAALRFRQHLDPGGVLILEPWFTPDNWHPGRIYLHTSDEEGLTVVRMSHSTVRGNVSELAFHYLIGTSSGIEHRLEHHALGLFTQEQMVRALEDGGFQDVDYDPEGLTGRGLYVARVTDSSAGVSGPDGHAED